MSKITKTTRPNDYAIVMDIHNILLDILNSYNEHDNVITEKFMKNLLKGFIIDYPRMTVKYNGGLINHTVVFHNILTSYDTYNFNLILDKQSNPLDKRSDPLDKRSNPLDKQKIMTFDMYVILLLLTTQASFFNSFSLITDIYSDPENDIYVSQTKDCPTIEFRDTKDELRILIKKGYKTINPNKNETYAIFHTCLSLTFLLDTTCNIYNPHIAMLYWMIES